jgi:hypothetical protein
MPGEKRVRCHQSSDLGQHAPASMRKGRGLVGASAATVGAWELTDADLAPASELIDQTLSLNATLEAASQLRQEVVALRKRRERQREVDRHVRAETGRIE